MGHPGPFDKTLLALGLLWLLCFGLSLHSAIAQVGYPSLILSAANEPDGYPSVVGLVPEAGTPEAGLALGDRLLRVGETDLRGRGHVALYEPFARAARAEGVIRVRYERAGVAREATLPVASYRIYWPRLPASLVFALAAALLTLRAPRSRMLRAFAQTFLVAACFLACTFGGGRAVSFFAISVHVASVTLVIPLSLRAALLFPDGEPPPGPLARLGPWAFAVLGLFEASRFYEFPFPRSVGVAAMTIGDLVFFLLLLAIVTRAYRRADPVGRRQLKWVLLGVYLAVALPIATTAVAATDLSSFPVLVISMAALALIPISMLIAIARYNLFDIDRLINSTASYSLLVILLALVGEALFEPLAGRAATALGLGATTGQVVFVVLLAVLLVPAQHRWRPYIERVFFKERYALDRGIAELLSTLSSCTDTRELTERAGAGLHGLLRPEACVVYAGVEQIYAPVFVEGRAVPPAFEADSPLIGTLRGRRAPLSLSDAGRRPDEAPLGPFDRAALETLQAEVVVPVRRDDALAAFVCLGPKRSGDVYTSTDLSLLGAVAATVSTALRHFDQDETIREAQAMQESLRRYVPAAVAAQLASGAELTSGEREVSVLFVDIRGYAGYAEERSAAEIFSTLNRYTRCVSDVVRRHGGSVVEFNGDGMMTIFGAPRAIPEKERAATEAGREILHAVAALPVEGEERLEVGVGVATGEAFVGNIQAADRLIWSAVGNTTNLAARLQEMTRELDAAMVIDAATWSRAAEAARGFEKYAAALIRGRRKTEDIYALPLAAPSAVREGPTAGRETQLPPLPS